MSRKRRAWIAGLVLCAAPGSFGVACSAAKASCTLTCDSSGGGLSISSSCEQAPFTDVTNCSFDTVGRPTRFSLQYPSGRTIVCDDINYDILGNVRQGTCWATDGSMSCVLPEGSSEKAAYGLNFTSGCALPSESVSKPKGTCSMVIGDGACDEPQGTGLCAAGKDPDDCTGPEEPVVTECLSWCDAIAAAACPADDTSSCESVCLGRLRGDAECRSAWAKALACDAMDDEKTCGADGKSVVGATCSSLLATAAACR